MRAYVDQDTCIGCGACAATCPEVFKMNVVGKAYVAEDTTDENRDDVMNAIEVCPVEAIREEE